MKIQVIRRFLYRRIGRFEGEVLTVEDEIGKRLIQGGLATTHIVAKAGSSKKTEAKAQ